MGESPRIYSPNSELGFYFNDTRYLGIWELIFNGFKPVSLSHELRFLGNTAVFSMTNRDFQKIGGTGRIPRDTFLIRRILTLHQDTLFETVEIKNFDNQLHSLQLEQWAGGKFDDVFEVRGFPRLRRGRMLPSQEEIKGNQTVTLLQYEGLDNRIRKTYVSRLFEAEKIRTSPGLVGYFSRINIPPKETVSLKSVVSFESESKCYFLGSPYIELNIADKMHLLGKQSEEFSFWNLTFETDNAIFNRSIKNAQTDIFMLLTEEPGSQLYPYAGIPWFSAPFGRDGLITAYQMLPWYPNLAKGVLDFAFEMQGTQEDPFTDEQPGKIFHELRQGEMSKTREVPFIPYYGSVDSTPLILILLHDYIRWTHDIESLKKWWPTALKALEWIEKWGDSDQDGFLEYAKQSPSGLVNQGWKDSHDSVMHADGRLAKAPIRLCEVQGYAFKARMGLASLAKLLNEDELSSKLRLEALQLKANFLEQFWDSEKNLIYLALAADNREPCSVLSSNMGHCLWSQILNPQEARKVADHLMSDAMFSGHGIRTLADTETSYNPLSYHNGSVWPHDNSIIMKGLRNYGFISDLEKLALGLFQVLESSEDFRLPELFCGFRKRGNSPPIPYEVACKPQAWAAGSIFLMIRAMLGVSIDTDQNHLVFNNPILTPKINYLKIKGLRGRDWEIDVAFQRTQKGTVVDILRREGNVRVLTVR